VPTDGLASYEGCWRVFASRRLSRPNNSRRISAVQASAEQESEAGSLLALVETKGRKVPVLLLSATPYRGLSYITRKTRSLRRFSSALAFLENADVTDCKIILAEYNAALPSAMTPSGLARLRTQGYSRAALRRVMPDERSSSGSQNTRCSLTHRSRCVTPGGRCARIPWHTTRRGRS